MRPGAYGLGPKQLFQELETSQANLRQLAEETGGVAFVGRNDFNQAFDRIVQENSSYYVSGTTPPTIGVTEGCGTSACALPAIPIRRSRIASDTRRREDERRAIPRPANRSIRARALTAELMQTMASPLPKTGLQLKVSAIAKKGVGKNTDIEVLIDTLGKDLTFTEKNGTFNNRLSMSVGVFNKEGKSVAAERPDVDLNLRPGDACPRDAARRAHSEAFVGSSRSISGSRRGAGQREDQAGQRAFRPRRAGLYEESDRAEQYRARRDRRSRGLFASKPGFDPFNGLLPGAPTALAGVSRTTARSQSAAEVYVNKLTPTHRIDITATVKADDGRVVFTNTEERSSEELHGTPGGLWLRDAHPHQGLDAGALRADDRSQVASHGC